MISAIITAAGKNRRMEKDQERLGIEVQNKLLLDLDGKPVIIQTLEHIQKTGIEECIIVLGHHSNHVKAVLGNYTDNKVKVISNPENGVELSETLLNGVINV